MKQKINLFVCLLLMVFTGFSQNRIIPGAERMDQYLSLIKNKSVAVFANPGSLVKHTSLIDTFLKRGVKIVRIFGPEHGYKGTADAGEKVGNFIDPKTGIEVISLYGKHNKPTTED
ncbi:MAG: exo-beta-N-acetylmuramidase NamZ domain-containing protein, partial [Ginsengibacter sp.]